jgi:hypothetical protein
LYNKGGIFIVEYNYGEIMEILWMLSGHHQGRIKKRRAKQPTAQFIYHALAGNTTC